MVTKTYFALDQIPTGQAGMTIEPGCIVLEGGAFRGLYTQGVLDALMLADINLQTTIGVSAGALSGLDYMSGQIGRSARLNLKYRSDPKYVGLKARHANHSVIGFDMMFYGEAEEYEPFDWQRFNDPARQFYAVATNCDTGRPEYFEKSSTKNILEAVRASASMPFVSRMVNIDGHGYLDGGCSDKIPVQWAIHQGFEKVVVVRTRPRDYRKAVDHRGHAIMDVTYRHYPEFLQSLKQSNQNYNDTCDLMDQLESEGHICVIAPSEPVRIQRLEADVNKLGALYFMGLQDGKGAVKRVKEYLGGSV
ncbi:patatin-like phospholipase family protein [Catenisphaera adipataccumulans]|uniref:Putative patatin/cPLA2 family phospholipase n=1 Tax=Catenisphaera adipataccumulans TaxID=700500 RepID=A0A7W8CZ21_9FIRM|nr:patatin family protein [Catenisphaera adipataccumulans]MBB5183018.1 putative patatin/cPLA2 family phospholipase [Catenisphaera adipataccumulans]